MTTLPYRQSPRILAIEGAMPIDGGLPLLKGGLLVGGIGAPGATPSQDGEIAAAGVVAFGSLSQ